MKAILFDCERRPVTGNIGSGFLVPGSNAVSGQGGPSVRPEDMSFDEMYENISEGVPLRSVLGEDFPLIWGASEFLCAKIP